MTLKRSASDEFNSALSVCHVYTCTCMYICVCVICTHVHGSIYDVHCTYYKMLQRYANLQSTDYKNTMC